ncbi:CDK-activating kinase assembly factor MAT1-domain-containing protein [Xylariales sp. PMI_506]|nr:CDK-activating kinase assembly factor MAT1-domain-containing protein [Xylariales sp. PMI_506]
MSRKPISTTTIARAPASYAAPANAIPDDICPVCKRVRYLNTNMVFQINPECYHPMCSQCVENIFKSGPAQCPYASCSKTLRIKGFRQAYFGDLIIEREVDIRKRVGAVFNNTQDDFETLRDYNNYLQDVEDLTFALVNGDDEERVKAEEQLIAYELEHKAQIERNKKKGTDMEEARVKKKAEAAAVAKARKAELEREEEEARKEEAKLNEEVMEALQRGEAGTAAEIQERLVAAKKLKLAQINGTKIATSQDSGAVSGRISIRGLRQKRTGPTEDEEDRNKPYDPFGGVSLEPNRYTLHDSYENPHLDIARTRDDHKVPGYSVQEYVARAMFEAFAGLGVMIEDEKSGDQQLAGAIGAMNVNASSSMKMEVDDVFA